MVDFMVNAAPYIVIAWSTLLFLFVIGSIFDMDTSVIEAIYFGALIVVVLIALFLAICLFIWALGVITNG